MIKRQPLFGLFVYAFWVWSNEVRGVFGLISNINSVPQKSLTAPLTRMSDDISHIL